MTGNPAPSNLQRFQIYHDIARPSREVLKPFADVGVSDVLEGLEMDTLLDPAIRPVWDGAQIIGPALTVLNTSGDTLMMHYAVELSQPGDVLVLVSDQPNPSAVWGKMVTVVARARNLAGVIVDGNVRDSAFIREVKFPVWARAYSPRGSTRKGPGSINVPVSCGGVIINPGDLIMADDDGIIVIPQSKMDAALSAAQARLQREKNIMQKLEQGISPYTILGLDAAMKQAGLEEYSGQFID
jgi:4-hydroxy-4-methyl-2-oxoglutarate aldolase